MKEEIYQYEIKLFECPFCRGGDKMKATSEKSEKECVTNLIDNLRTHFKICNSKKDKKISIEFNLNIKKRIYVKNLTTYESIYEKRKLII